MTTSKTEIIVIGGSSGCIPVLKQIITALPGAFDIPVIIIIHRKKNTPSGLETVLSADKKIVEPEDKMPLENGMIYLAPQNYHLLVEDSKTFSLDYSEQVNYSRPSIDVTFMSVADVYKGSVMGILLSGANKDGAEGLSKIIENKGCGIVQDPATAEYPVMPEAAISLNEQVVALDVKMIINEILNRKIAG